ncbi:MAG: PilZ domain-containing protein [Deltaproteobacteria bacterium]|nr:PilZ domain-containing protein [Deltaproteobacteria bacterium]
MSTDRRSWHRFSSLCPVRLESAAHGETFCVARNVSEGGIFIETREPLPIGTAVAVTFEAPDGATPIVARGAVKHHYFFHYGSDSRTRSLTGMGVRFSSFEAEERDEFPEWAFGVAPTPLH